MASLNLSFSLFAFLFLFYCTDLNAQSNSDDVDSDPRDASDKFPCLQSLLPCASYLKSPKPAPVCCVPLEAAIQKDVNCLCDLFNNQEILNNFNVTPDEALQLPKKCGSQADLTKCKTSSGGKAPPPPSPSTPAPPTLTPTTPTPTTPSKSPPKGSTSDGGRLSILSEVAVFLSGGMVYLVMSI